MGSSKVREHYRTINGCKRQIQCEQIFWVFGVLTLIVFFTTMVAIPIVKEGSTAMVLFMVFAYFLCPLILYDYCKLTCTDPVDPNILQDQNYSVEQ